MAEDCAPKGKPVIRRPEFAGGIRRQVEALEWLESRQATKVGNKQGYCKEERGTRKTRGKEKEEVDSRGSANREWTMRWTCVERWM